MSSSRSPRGRSLPSGPAAPGTDEPRATARLSALNLDHYETREQAFHSQQFHRRLVVAHLLLSMAWIFLSDRVVDIFFNDPAPIQTYKGLLFVVLSSAFLYAVLTRHQRHIERIETKIQARDAHIGRIIDTMANGVALIDLDATIVDVNPALANMLGRTREAIIRRKLAPVELENGEALSMSTILRRAREAGQWSGEITRFHKDGSPVPMHLTLAPLYDTRDILTGYVGDYVDLREIRTAEAHLDGLGTMIEQLATETDLEELGQKAVLAALELTASHVGGVILLDPNTGTLEPRWFTDTATGPIDANAFYNMATDSVRFVAHIIETGSPRIFDDLGMARDHIPLTDPRNLRSLAAVPFTVRRTHRGALVVASSNPREALSVRHLPLLQGVARQIGVALHRHDLLEEAHRSEARFRTVINTVPDILYSASLPDLHTTFISPSVERILGYPPSHFLANPTLWRKQIDPADREKIDQAIRANLDTKQRYSVEYRCWNHDRSHYHWVEDRGRIEFDNRGEPRSITGVVSNITARKHAEERLAFLAFHDKLTGLPNRNGLLEALTPYFDRGPQPAAILLYCDLDRFHLINDIHGHESGDALLIETARRFRDILPDDAILSRIGADEFVAFLPCAPQTALNELKAEAQRTSIQLVTSFRQPFFFADQSAYLSVSIGISLLSPDCLTDARSLLKDAHRALVHAKELGPSNFAFFAGELARRQQRRLSLQSRINRALENDEFSLHYQPIIDLQTGAIVGAEALLRWTTSEGESISPSEFIPIAEQSGLIIPLGDWVLERGCHDLQRWLSIDPHFKLSLNLSPRQFFHLEIVEKILSAVERAKVSTHCLELELTESAMLFDPEQTASILTRLQEAGFSIAIDDFGTGYSSLERLKHLPVETLKIDRSFVRDLPDAHRDASIVRSVVTLSKNFSMKALAEGIETDEQWQYLRSLGCPFGQGYFFSPPLPNDHFETILSSQPAWFTTG